MIKRPLGHQDEQHGVSSKNLSEDTRDDSDVDAAGAEVVAADEKEVVVDDVEELNNVLAAELPTDTTQHYLNQIGTRPLLSVTEEVNFATLVKQGNFEARQKMIEHNLRLVVLDRQALHQPRPGLARSDRGWQSRPDARNRQVRARTRFSFFDLCDLVDTPNHRARHHEPGVHGEVAGAYGA